MIRSANLTSSVSRNAGGLFDGVRRLVQCLEEKGIEERVFALQDEFTEADLSAWQPADVSAFKPTWPEQFGYSPRFLEELLAYQPELVHTHGIWTYPSVAASVFNRTRRCPHIISSHGMLDPWAVQNSRWRKRIAYFLYERAHLRAARCLRALCEEEARSIRQLGLKNDIAIIPNGIDLPTGPPPAHPPWKGAVEPGTKVLLFLGRIHPKKGLVNLLKAWAQVQNSKPASWVLVIAGWDQGGHERLLKQLATELGLRWTAGSGGQVTYGLQNDGHPREHSPSSSDIQSPASVVFMGPQFNETKAACYHFCDAFILPSFSEGVPMTVLEAWANSKPVLMTPQCNLPQGFAAGAALKVEAEPESITAGLNELLRMTEVERAAMGGRAYALAREHFVWPRIAGKMQGVYEWMLGGGPKPGCLADF